MPYRLEMEPSEDIDLSFRLGAAGQLGNLSEVIYRIRTHEHSVTRTMARRMETKTLYLRVKAAFEYGYDVTFADKLYMAAQLLTMYIMPFHLPPLAIQQGPIISTMKPLCVAYHMPYPTTVYAARYVYLGFQHAFAALGCEFVSYTPGQQLKHFLEAHRLTSSLRLATFFIVNHLTMNCSGSIGIKG